MEETGGWGYSASMSRRGHGADVRHMERNEALRKSALREKSGDNGLGEARADLAEAMDRLKRADPSGDISKELGAVQSAKNRVSAIQDETKATKELASAKEKVVEIEKKASESLSKAAGRGGFASKLESDIGVVRAEAIDEIRKSGKSPELVRRIQQAGAVREYGVILAAKSAAEKRGYRLEDESFSPDYRAEHGPSMYDPDGHLRAGIFGGFTRPTAPSGYISPDEQLREARDQERRGMSQIGVRGALAGDSARGTVEATYQARLRYAAIEEAAQIRIANLKGDAAAKETALAMAAEKRYDASIERETALMHLALQQKQEFQSLAVGLFEAARGGGAGVSRFLGGQVSHLGDTVVGNAAGMAWPAIKSAMGGLHATDDPNSFMGRLLKGTPFGADPLAAATTANTAATVANTAALTGMGTAGMFGGSGVAGGAASGTNANGDSGPINQPFSTSIRNQAIGYGIGFAAAGFGAYNGFSRGGAQGALQGTGSLLGAAAMIPGPQQPYIMAAAAVTGLVAAVLGDPKQRRSNDIGNALKYNQFVAPVALNASMSTGGTYADYDRFGNVRGSSLSPFPSVDQPYFDYRNGVTVPGRTDSQFGPPIVVNINAIDGPSVQRVLMSNPDAVAAGVVAAANRGGNAMMTTLRSQM